MLQRKGVLWKHLYCLGQLQAGDDSDFAFLLASGRIGVCDEFCDQWRNGDERSNFVPGCYESPQQVD